MKEIIVFLNQWQTLIGAFLGGIVGLLAALIVAWDARKREQRAALYILLTDLAEAKIAFESFKRTIHEQQAEKDGIPPWAIKTYTLLRGGISLSPLFEPSVALFRPIDDYLAAHLSLFYKLFLYSKVHLDRLERILDASRLSGKLLMTKEEFDSECKVISENFESAAEHAIWAEFLLGKLTIRWTAPLHRLFRKWRKPKDEKESRELLIKGGKGWKKEVV